MEKKCVYLSDTESIHDLRWRNALQSMGWEVSLEVTDDQTPVIAGPITTNRLEPLAQQGNPVIGLSWGWDLHAAKGHQSNNWLSKLSGLVVDSVPTRDIAINLGMNPQAIVMIPWGIDLADFTVSDSIRKIELSIVSLRALEKLYRVDTILDAVALLQEDNIECSLTVGNDGSQSEELKRQAAELDLKNVTFIGKVQESALPQLLSDHGVYVSAAETDGTSVTLMQAMAMGAPVVVSNTPGNIAWLKSGPQPTGRFFELGDPADLALKLSEVVDFPDHTRELTQLGREIIERDADWNQNIWRLDELLTRQTT